ncbi:DUF2442 domain-containing protein [Rhodoferax antarcticus]|jgi:hypothetical protein|uniref:DUF2442 domain-containing protein n=1 Tax=Rhodoferax antarcticus TaxID=81479 RepID=UPI00095830CD|nr:DUF2442 domain-containing protein [Rhodoferax antarcticus]APW48664.1 hypothetical protein RA876_19590 [Rhodoferax antarcticus]MCW2314406.1 hypothetical protein [Rhodoferax antarcticus]
MTTMKASTRFDEPVTPEVLDQAIERGRKRASAGVRATAVQYVPQFGSLLFSFLDRSAVALPVSNYPELATLDESDLQALTLGFGGSALCLKARDLHVSIAGLVSASQPLMDMAASLVAVRNGRKSSTSKSAAARENGRKGGRPKLALTA